MNALVLSAEAKARAHALALRSAQPENWFRPMEPGFVAGDGAKRTEDFDSYRCVFTYTVHDGTLYRHLSVSVLGGGPEVLPDRVAMWTLASWFGFTGGRAGEGEAGDAIVAPGDDWQIGTKRAPRVAYVGLAQRIGPAPATTARAS